MLQRCLLLTKSCGVNPLAIQKRFVRPSVKIGPEKFQLTLDVRNFTKDEMRVKVQPELLTIEGRQERKTKQGCILRSFTRKFRLPEGCVLNSVESSLSPDGVMTITAKRCVCDQNNPCVCYVPIRYSGKVVNDVSMIPPPDKTPVKQPPRNDFAKFCETKKNPPDISKK